MSSSRRKTSRPRANGIAIENKRTNLDRGIFDDWLDERVKALFRAVIEEPLPDEMVKLIRSSAQPIKGQRFGH